MRAAGRGGERSSGKMGGTPVVVSLLKSMPNANSRIIEFTLLLTLMLRKILFFFAVHPKLLPPF